MRVRIVPPISDASIVPIDAALERKITDSISAIDATLSNAYHSRPYAIRVSFQSGNWRMPSIFTVVFVIVKPVNIGAVQPTRGSTGAEITDEMAAPQKS